MEIARAWIQSCIVASALLLFAGSHGLADDETIRIEIAYEEPRDPDLDDAFEDVRERRVLERLQEFLSPFRLSGPLKFTFRGCDGEDDAFYFEYDVTVCYELIDELQWAKPKKVTAHGLAPHDAVAGPFFSTILHEFAHAFFQLHQTPIFGREEDAADQFAAYIILLLDDETASRLIRGTAYAYMTEANERESASTIEFSSEHGIAEQRYYNVLCMAYGSDPEYFSDLRSKDVLPEDRAELCQDEFEQIEDAYKALILPHVDLMLAKEVWGKLVVRTE